MKDAWLMGRMLSGYTRKALFRSGYYDIECYRVYAKGTEGRFDLRCGEFTGSTASLTKLVESPWDEAFVVVSPGREITF